MISPIKYFIAISIVIIGSSKGSAQTPAMANNKTLRQAIDQFLDSANIGPSTAGVVYMHFQGLYFETYEYDTTTENYVSALPRANITLTLEMAVSDVTRKLPSYFFFHNGRPVCVFTGFEKFLETDDKRKRYFLKQVRPWLRDGIFVRRPFMQIFIHGNQFQIVSTSGWYAPRR